MSNALIMYTEGSGRMVDVIEFAEIRKVDPRTVREWLRLGLLPDARKDSRGKWHIPVDAVKLDSSDAARKSTAVDVVPNGAVEVFPTRVEQLLEMDDEDPRPRPRAWFTVPEAGKILGISPYRIREQRDRFGLVPWGPNGLLVVPAPVIRDLLGIRS